MADDKKIIFSMVGVNKIFPPQKQVLKNIYLSFFYGAKIGIIGLNGSGKSTLLKILNGDYQPSSGHYILDGKEERFLTPFEAIEAGIGLIYQERQMFDELSVAENIFVGRLPLRRGLIDFVKLEEQAKNLIEEFNLPLSPSEKVKNLSVAMQQMVEIMKVYSRGPKVIAFDEPTACLSDKEAEVLFELIEKLRQQGLIVIYVSHRMNEVFRLSNKIVVLKDGKFIACHDTQKTNEVSLVNQMVGRKVESMFGQAEREPAGKETILSVEGISGKKFRDISFELKQGEILGFFGLVGAGRTEVMRAIFGADSIDSGKIKWQGKTQKIDSTETAISLGIAYCSEDRKNQGIIPLSSVKDNISLVILKKLCRRGFIRRKKEERFAVENINKFNIKTSSIQKRIYQLSGGNQQKVLLARWMAMNPKVLILDEPTKGIDVGAKIEIYRMIYDIANQGISVIVVSSELPEVIGLSDRIIVMRNEKIAGEISKKDANEEIILQYAMLEKGGN